MSLKDFGDIIITVGAVVTIVDFSIRLYRERQNGGGAKMGTTHSPRSLFFPAAFVLAAWAAVAVNYFAGNYAPPPIVPTTQPDPSKVFLQSWGLLPPATYQVTINSGMIIQYKNTDKVILLTRTAFSDVDRMTDTYLEKSTPYTIEDGIMVLAHASINKLRFMVERPNVLEFDVVMIPSQFSEEQINNLGDVEKLGGRILSSAVQTITIPKPQAPTIPYAPPCAN